MISLKSIIENSRFSHRPQAGISIGVYVDRNSDKIYVAAAFRNPNDQFNRRLARQIIAQRIYSSIKDSRRVHFVAWEPLNGKEILSGGVMHHLRDTFKPDVEEADTLFVNVSTFGDVELRLPIEREDAFLSIVGYFIFAVEKAEKELLV